MINYIQDILFEDSRLDFLFRMKYPSINYWHEYNSKYVKKLTPEIDIYKEVLSLSLEERIDELKKEIVKTTPNYQKVNELIEKYIGLKYRIEISD